MAYNVRLFGHAGLARMTVISAGQFSSDSVFQLTQPYLWTQLLSCSAVAVSSVVNPVPAGQSLDATTILRIEVPDGQSIRYEVNNGLARNITAGTQSPILTGRDQIKWGANFTLSIVDAAGLP
jgi:hypothetical protein